MNKQNFAAFVRAGLKQSGVKENNLTFIASPLGENGAEANIIGLALIGQIGIADTLDLAKVAKEELKSNKAGAATKRINDYFDFPEAIDLLTIHAKKTAEEICTEFEAVAPKSNFKKIFMPQKAIQAVMAGSKPGVIIPKNFFQNLEGEYVEVDGIDTASPFETSNPLDLDGFLPEEIANLCGFENDEEALTFTRNSYKNSDLTLHDLMAYQIRA